jgi:hypothetical protein
MRRRRLTITSRRTSPRRLLSDGRDGHSLVSWHFVFSADSLEDCSRIAVIWRPAGVSLPRSRAGPATCAVELQQKGPPRLRAATLSHVD